MGAIKQLCQSSIWLDSNAIKQQGPSQFVVNNYLSHEIKKQQSELIPREEHYYHYGSPRGLTFTRIRLINNQDDCVSSILFQEDLHILLDIEVIELIKDVRLGIVIHSLDGNLITALHHTDDPSHRALNLEKGSYQIKIKTNLPLVPGHYSISLFVKPLPGFWNSQDNSWDYVENAFLFTIESDRLSEGEVLPTGGLILSKSSWSFKPKES